MLPDFLSHIPSGAAYAVVALAVLAESVLLVGAFVPTLSLLVSAGALAQAGHLSLPLIIASAAGAVVAGDLVAHRTGNLLGGRLRTGRLGRRIPRAAWRQAETLMTRHGGRAVLVARFLPVVRTLAPHFAGASRLPYHRIAPYSASAACLWATVETGIGYGAATRLHKAVDGPVLTAAALVALGGGLLWVRLRRRVVPR
ncbi:VTT domain-containing protein [Nonomuraea angiospora]|uniref:DedA family protein n=1 Tax=Nonomuraea angiospora TaxID=46172 RepID=UPI0033185474